MMQDEWKAYLPTNCIGGRAMIGGVRRGTSVYGGVKISVKPGLNDIPQSSEDLVVSWHPDHLPPEGLREHLERILIAEALREERGEWELAMFGYPK